MCTVASGPGRALFCAHLSFAEVFTEDRNTDHTAGEVTSGKPWMREMCLLWGVQHIGQEEFCRTLFITSDREVADSPRWLSLIMHPRAH